MALKKIGKQLLVAIGIRIRDTLGHPHSYYRIAVILTIKIIINTELPTIVFLYVTQTSQLSRFGRETHDFLTDLSTAYQSHDFSRYSRNIIINVRLIRYKCHVIHMLPGPGSEEVGRD